MRLDRGPISFLLSSTLAFGLAGCVGDDTSIGGTGGTPDAGPSEASASETGASETGASETGASETGAKETGASETGAGDGASLPTLAAVGHIVVIYQENHSFDNLLGSYPGAEGLASASAMIPQIDPTSGMAYATLPEVDPNVPMTLMNQPFDISQFVPANQKTIDLVHRWYQEQYQINAGKMDSFVGVSDAKGLSMGFYPTSAIPLVTFINTMSDKVTVLDHFFHAAFGGSFLNHQWLIAAASPTFPNAPMGIVATVDANGKMLTDGQVTPDGFVVNTSYSVNAPHPATTAAANLVPNQTQPTIGDRLSAAGIDWAWYAGGWNDALAGNPDASFQFHHQPFVFFQSFADGTPAKAAHLKDETDFMAGVAAGQLPPVTFVKPLGTNNEHPGYADLVTGQNHVVSLIQSIVASPLWSDTVIIVTYDENGGFWDHVPPPVVDKWGPGSRVPTIVFSPFAKSGVDSTSYDTTAILKLIETRYGLDALGTRDLAQADLSAHALKLAPSTGDAGH
jgi:phospholipase C